MKRTTLPALILLLSPAPQAFAQENAQKAPATTLEHVKSLFVKADANADGRVTLREAQAAGHSLAEFREFDADGDGVIAQPEFLVGYAERLKNRGVRVSQDLADEVARLQAHRQERRSDAADSGNAQDVPERRSSAPSERVRAGESGAERAANRSENVQESRNAPETARGRATSALSRLRESRQDRLQDAGPERRANAARTDAQGPTDGPAARRTSPEELRRILQERQRDAAQESRRDPRAEQARDRVQAERRERERAGSSNTGGETRGRATDGARTGGRSGPAGGRTGRAGTSSSRASRGGI